MTEDTVTCDSRPGVFLVVVWSTWPATSSNSITFSALLSDGSVVSWGERLKDSECVQQLVDVRQLASTDGAFCAVLANGLVQCWGHGFPDAGDSGLVDVQLRDVREVLGARNTFVALRADGAILMWGGRYKDSPELREELKRL